MSELNTFTPKLNRYGILTGMKIWLDKRIELLLKPISELKDVLLVCDHICFPLYFRIPIIASFSPLKSTRIGVNLPSNVPIPENIYSYIVNDSIASIGTLRNDELSVNKTLLFSFNSIFDVITILKGQCFVKDEYTSSIFRPFYQHFLNLPYRPYILKSDADLRMPIWSTMCTLSEIQIDPDPLVEMSHYLDFMLLGAPDNIISFFKKE